MAGITDRQGLTLRISVTDRCNLRCLYCRPAGSEDEPGCSDPMSFTEITALSAILHRHFGLAKIRLTGGEPLLRPGLERLVSRLAEVGTTDLALTTNALSLADQAAKLKAAGLRRVNISLDSLKPEVFRRLSRGGNLNNALHGLDSAIAAGLTPVKLNTVVIRGMNDSEVCDLLDFALARNCELRFIELMPIGPGAELFTNGFVPAAAVREQLTKRFKLQPLAPEPGAAARRYKVQAADGNTGSVGFISSCSMPFCGGCTRLRLTADGLLLGCLARNGGVSVRGLLRANDEPGIVELVNTLLGDKRNNGIFEQNHLMAAIGG